MNLSYLSLLIYFIYHFYEWGIILKSLNKNYDNLFASINRMRWFWIYILSFFIESADRKVNETLPQLATQAADSVAYRINGRFNVMETIAENRIYR